MHIRCDLLKNSYLCLLNNTLNILHTICARVVICWKIRIFAYWTTPNHHVSYVQSQLWFAEKFVSLLIEQHPKATNIAASYRCDLLKNSYLCLLNNTSWKRSIDYDALWFAEKFVSLLIEQHPKATTSLFSMCCDLLKNSYLCLLNNTHRVYKSRLQIVVICWKIRIFAYWTTPRFYHYP